jgi:hypothetical protein
MTDHDATPDRQDDPSADHPAGEIRLHPRRPFGLRAAALAGFVMTTGAAAMVAAAAATPTTPGTTCCPTGP